MKSQLPVIVIPAYQPGNILLEIVDQLLLDPYPLIVVVNDGSSVEKKPIFQELSIKERVVVLHHAVNLGKGEALKTAFNYVLLEAGDIPGVVTVDADGQHLPEDVKKIAEALLNNPHSLCLGIREFHGDIPLRSRFGNILTKYVFRIFVGKAIIDTQTGLRGIPLSFLYQLLKVRSTGYEFELEMLVLACKQSISIEQIKINTVYEKDNPTSHFNPIFDSLKIYFVFVRFVSASLSASFVDMIVFSLVLYLSSNVLFSLLIGRIIGCTFQFLIAKKVVFHSDGKVWIESIKYILLAIALMFASYSMITVMVLGLGINPYLSKIIAETILFVTSFEVQRGLIFMNNK